MMRSKLTAFNEITNAELCPTFRILLPTGDRWRELEAGASVRQLEPGVACCLCSPSCSPILLHARPLSPLARNQPNDEKWAS